MKRKVLFVLVILLLTGCTVVRINTSSIDTIIDVILTKDNNLYNRVGRGYKYYIPRGVTYIDTDETNDKLYSNGIYYYLYVDVISYYQKIPTEYEEKKDLYYSKKITKEDGYNSDGYLEIEKKDNLYYIKFVYNYAKIETISSEEKLNDTILNCAYILSTIQYNNDVIELMIDSEKLNIREEKYNVFKNKKSNSNTNTELKVNNDN